MGTNIKSLMKGGGVCLPDSSTLKAFFQYLLPKYPEEKEVIQKAQDCFTMESEGARKVCLKHVLEGEYDWSSPYDIPKAINKQTCEDINGTAKDLMGRQADAFQFLLKTSQHLYKPSRLYKEEDITLFNEVIAFYFSKFPKWTPAVKAYLRDLPEIGDRLKAYDPRNLQSGSLSPFVCPRQFQWERRDLKIDGLPYPIPVFYPEAEHLQWELHRELLETNFEVLKGFLSPSDFEKVLHPGGSIPDFSLSLSKESYDESPAFKQCHTTQDWASGFYSPDKNLISLFRSGKNLLESKDKQKVPWQVMKGPLVSTFYHEFGHSLYYHFLNEERRQNLKLLYLWTKTQIEQDRKKLNYAPNSTNFYKNLPYSLNTHEEFLADMIEEYISLKITQQKPKDAAQLARFRLMGNFFSASGIKPEAFDQDQIETAYHYLGYGLIQRTNTFSLPIRFSFQNFALNEKGTHYESPDFTLGLGVGFYNKAVSKGFLGGVSVSFDISLLGKTNRIDSLTQTTSVPFRIYDLGVQGLFGINLGKVQLVFEPGLGYRHVEIDNKKLDKFWVGGDAGFRFLDGVLGLGFRGRWMAGGYDVGLVLNADLPQIWQ